MVVTFTGSKEGLPMCTAITYLSSQGLAVKAYGLEVRAPTGQRSGENTNLVDLYIANRFLHILTDDIS